MMILMSSKFKADADQLATAAFEDLVRWATINTLYWTDEEGLFVFESNYSADEIKTEFLSDPSVSHIIDHLVIFEIPRFKNIESIGLPSEKILRAYADIVPSPGSAS